MKINSWLKQKDKDAKVLKVFPVLHQGWDGDYEGWIVLHKGKKKIVLTNYDRPYFANTKDLLDNIKKYQDAVNETHLALEEFEGQKC